MASNQSEVALFGLFSSARGAGKIASLVKRPATILIMAPSTWFHDLAAATSTLLLPGCFQGTLIGGRRQIAIIKCPHHVQGSTLPRCACDYVEKCRHPMPEKGQKLNHNNKSIYSEESKTDNISSQDFQILLVGKSQKQYYPDEVG